MKFNALRLCDGVQHAFEQWFLCALVLLDNICYVGSKDKWYIVWTCVHEKRIQVSVQFVTGRVGVHHRIVLVGF